jgi:hypothetical protein
MDWKKSRLSVDLTSKLRTMVEKSHNRTIIGIMLEARVKRTVTLTVENASRLWVMHQDSIGDRRAALALDSNGKRKVCVQIRSRHGTRETSQQSLDNHRIDDLAERDCRLEMVALMHHASTT